MTRIFRNPALPLVALAVVLFASAAFAAPAMHQGKVTGVAKGELMLLDMKDGETETFIVNDSTKIMLDAQPAKLSDIQVGFVAEVTAEMNTDGKLIAKSISASSKRSP